MRPWPDCRWRWASTPPSSRWSSTRCWARSRVLSVSSTTTLAILAGTELAIVVPDGDPAKLITATATLTLLVGAMLVLARVARLGFVADFISDAGAHRLQGRHRPRHRARPDPQAARHPHHQAGLLPRPAERRPARARDLAADARRWRWRRWSCWWAWIGSGRTRRRRWWPWASGIAASWLLRPRRRSASRPIGKIPQGLPSITLPDLSLIIQLAPAAAGMALMSFTESIASARAFAASRRSAGGREPRAGRRRRGQPRRRADRLHAVGRRRLADGGRRRRRRPLAADLPGHGGGRARDHAPGRAAARPAAERDAGDGRHRLLGRPDPACGVPRHPRRCGPWSSAGRWRRCSACSCSARCRASSSRSSCR